MSHPLHEVVVDADLVRALLAAQHPDLADRPLRVTAQGWDNVTVRIGEDLAARLPARELAARLLLNERRWLPLIATLVPVAVPVPVRSGHATADYPWAWSVVPWLAGSPADTLTTDRRDPWAGQLAETLAALHSPAPDDAPANAFRGVPLAARDATVADRLAELPGDEGAALRQAWADGLAAPAWDRDSVWLHGDPHPGNLLAGPHGLAAVLDFGDLTAGDPASDLSTAWLCFGPQAREDFWARYADRSDLPGTALAALRRRARAWAAAMVPVMLAHPDAHPGLAAVGRHATAQLVAELR
ncbi:phosphotransferase [Actinotalea sp. M2MS4P-6]|uniref:phosphotransferase n=1 Tax=Actinotalea sp. M2MS4P-6 TaxID=2983762 RepID=UPI0021E4389B|nr:phosphotransferase [Actinotalea sp. M2MS4P-6]MCV2396332.1 phosphotransferase [Actinotalea sp. M2MS4P-6]